MKILYHHRTLAKDGMNVHIQELVAALERRGHEVRVIGPGRPSNEVENPGKSTTLTELVRRVSPASLSDFAELGYNALELARLNSAVKSFRPDIVYERYNLFLLAGLWTSRAHGLPLILEVNSPLARERSEYGRLTWKRLAKHLEGRVWRAADAVLPVTHVLAEEIFEAGVKADRVHVMPNGVDLRNFSSSLDGGEVRRKLGLVDEVVMGFTGFIRPWHGLDRILDLIAAMRHSRRLHLVVVGDGPARASLEQQADKLGIRELVKFVGPIDRAQIPQYIAAFDIALQPSAVPYACPLKLVEYMAMGKAIVAPDQPNIRELIDDGRTGLLFEGDDTRALHSAVSRLAGDPQLRKRLAQGAASAVQQRGLTWDANARRIETLADICTAKSAPRLAGAT